MEADALEEETRAHGRKVVFIAWRRTSIVEKRVGGITLCSTGLTSNFDVLCVLKIVSWAMPSSGRPEASISVRSGVAAGDNPGS